MIETIPLIRGLLREIRRSAKESDASYALSRLGRLFQERSLSWEELIGSQVPAEKKARLTKILGRLSPASVHESRTALDMADGILRGSSLDLDTVLGFPRLGGATSVFGAPAPVAAGKRVLFEAHCSKHRSPFLVVAERDGNRLTWIGSRPMARLIAGDVTEIDEDVITISEFFRMEMKGWTCPHCGTGSIGEKGWFWHCGRCMGFHCMGTTGGRLAGSCGSCSFDPAQCETRETFGVHVSEYDAKPPPAPRPAAPEPQRISQTSTGRLGAPPAKPPPAKGKWWRK